MGYYGNEIDKTTIPPSHNPPISWWCSASILTPTSSPSGWNVPSTHGVLLSLRRRVTTIPTVTPWYYKLYPSIYPPAQYCVPDTKKAEKIEIMIDVALDLLRARNANKEFGRNPESDHDAGISADDLHSLLLSMKAPDITEEEFEGLWQRSVSELEKEAEIIVRNTINYTYVVNALVVKYLTTEEELLRFKAANEKIGTTPRFKSVDGICNFRDLGAWPLVAPRLALQRPNFSARYYVRPNLLFPCANTADETESGLKALKKLHIRAIYDLRRRRRISRYSHLSRQDG